MFLSDGITDAENAEGEMFGIERVTELLRANTEKSAAELATIILDAVGRFQAGAERFDDETVVVLRVR